MSFIIYLYKQGSLAYFVATFVLYRKMKKNNFKQEIFLLILVAFFASTILVFGAVNTSQDSSGPIDFKSSSSNYQFDAEVGAPAVGQSVSSNYIFDHGAFWDDSTNSTVAKIKWLFAASTSRFEPIPGQRTNDAMLFTLSFKQNGNLIYKTPVIASTTSEGVYDTGISLDNVPAGIYDVYVKGYQTLTKKYSNVNIVAGENILNFTQNDVSNTTKGPIELIAGDIGTSTLIFGDDIINGADMSVILNKYNQNGFFTADINHDDTVNGADISVILTNYNLSGDN